jgi:hypothetical protein
MPFGVNEMRLNLRQWLAALAIMLGCAWGIPQIWPRIERFDTGPDYRIPSALQKDYWLYQRRLEKIADPACVPVLGDSVIWGEYVRPTGTLTHFLNQETGRRERFVNCGMNGLFPLALEGLIDYYGAALDHRKLIVHCNVLWMSSAKADLSVNKEESFNHPRLVPQFFPRLPCYRADAAERLNAVVERSVGFFGWVGHVEAAYFDQRSIPRWTLEEAAGDPPRYPNAWRNPLAQITLTVPGDPPDDPQRGPSSPRHKPWTAGGAATTYFDWVSLDASLQWRAFQRVIRLLRGRGNEVLVILGPFNEHMVAEEQRGAFRRLRDGIAAWLAANGVAHVTAETLPSQLYADASHPLTDGYALLAKRICRDTAFRQWLGDHCQFQNQYQ